MALADAEVREDARVDWVMDFWEKEHRQYLGLLEGYGEAVAEKVRLRGRWLRGWLRVCWLVDRYGGGKKELREIRRLVLVGLGVESMSSLYRLAKRYEAGGIVALVHGNVGNTHAKVVGKEAVEIARGMLKRHATVSEIAERLGVSYGTAWGIVNAPEHVQANVMAKWGPKEWRRRFDMVIKRKRPSRANLLWVIDGTVVELLCGVNGKPSRIYWVYVIDAYDWRCIGYAFSYTETSDVVQRAVYNAYLERLALPAQIQTDNGSAFKSKQTRSWIERACKKFTPHAVGNARSKIAESWWNTFNGSFLKDELNWTGKNITSVTGPMLQSALNNRLKKAVKLGLPDIDGVVMQVERQLDRYHSKVSGDIEVSEQGGWYPTMVAIAAMFWDWRRVKGRPQSYYYDNNGIELTHEGVSYQFVVLNEAGGYDEEFHATQMGRRYYIKCDEARLDLGVVLYDGCTDAARPIAVGQSMARQLMALADHDEASRDSLAVLLRGKRAMYKLVKERADAAVDVAFEEEQLTNYKLALGHLGKGDLNKGEDFVKRQVDDGEMDDWDLVDSHSPVVDDWDLVDSHSPVVDDWEVANPL